MTKLSVGWAFTSAYGFVLHNFGTLLRLAAVPVILAIAVWVVALVLSGMGFAPLWVIMGTVLGTVLGVSFTVSWTRFVLLGARKTFSLGMRELKYLGLVLRLALIVILPAAIAFVLASAFADEQVVVAVVGLVFAASSIAFAVLFMRYAFVFPAAAVDQYRGFRFARSQLKGSTWRLFWASVLVALPFVVISGIVNAAFVDGHQSSAFGAMAAQWIFSFIVGWLEGAVVATVWALAYKRLTDPPAATEHLEIPPLDIPSPHATA